MSPLIASLVSFLIWWALGSAILFFIFQKDAKQKSNTLLKNAESTAREMVQNAEKQVQLMEKQVEDMRSDIRDRKKEITDTEEKLSQKDFRLEKKLEEIEQKQEWIYKKEQLIDERIADIEKKRDDMNGKLEEIAGMNVESARDLLLKNTEERYEKDILEVMEKKQKDLKTREAELAREILIKSIQQYAGDVTGETTQTMVHLANDDLKGKLIGKEGRNIIAFEKAAGVSLIIDDTPDTVFISSFDLFRRYIAKKSLEELIEDKRIQPARIEEIVEQNQKDAERLIADLGRKTVDEMGVPGIPDEILPLIGKFRFRTSYGQNILMHSKEVAYIAEAIAKLVGADAALALKGGLLHDLGKSMDHDVEGTHPEIGWRIARKYGLDEKTVNIIEWHHDDVPQICIETKIVQIADAISAVRPWARRMNVEEYIKRIQEMENIAMSFPGVSKAYALSAGREVRVFVDADTVSDLDAIKRAQEIAAQIEANCNYPWEVKINLYREKRVIEYAR